MEQNLDNIAEDLGANYKTNDHYVLTEIYKEVSSIASNISNRNADDKKLYPYIKTAVKSIYLCRGGEGLNSINESGKSLSFDDAITIMRNNIVKAGLRRLY